MRTRRFFCAGRVSCRGKELQENETQVETKVKHRRKITEINRSVTIAKGMSLLLAVTVTRSRQSPHNFFVVTTVNCRDFYSLYIYIYTHKDDTWIYT